MKFCNKCEKYLDLSFFHSDKTTKDGKCAYCKECKKQLTRNYVKNNKHKKALSDKNYRRKNAEKLNKYIKEYAKNNKEKLKEYKKQWYFLNKDKVISRVTKNHKKRLKTDINYKLAFYLRCRLNSAIYNNSKSGSFVRDLGCSIAELKIYLESKFQEGMTWENHGKWHLDHIKPLVKFNLNDREQFLQACHYTNLQPLWAIDNLKKGAQFLEV